MRVERRLLGCCALIAGLLLAEPCRAYEPATHQEFTFIAAKQLNRCLEGTGIPRLTPLQVRYVVKGDVEQAQGSWFFSQFRWGYYDRANQQQRTLLWVIDTRLHDHFEQLERELAKAQEMSERYSDLGYVANYLQNMTSPAHVVPVYFTRWWRFSLSDRFDAYPVDEGALEQAAQATDCESLLQAPNPTIEEMLRDTASATLLAVQRRIDGWPVTWQAFWKLADDPEQFGEYGRAGNNFGRRVEFKCGDTRCALLDKDPIYDAFAHERHVDAVNVTMRALLWMQRRLPVGDVAQ